MKKRFFENKSNIMNFSYYFMFSEPLFFSELYFVYILTKILYVETLEMVNSKLINENLQLKDQMNSKSKFHSIPFKFANFYRIFMV